MAERSQERRISDDWRGNQKSAADVLAGLLRKAEQRRAFCEALEVAIRAAHAVSEASWRVSLFPSAIRLNVGQVEVITLSEDDVYLLLDPATVPANLPDALGSSLAASTRYASVPGRKTLAALSGKDFARWYPLIKKAHAAMAIRAASAKKGTPHLHAFSEGVLLEAEQLLHRSFPRPSFVSRRGQLLVLIATKADVGLLRKAAERDNSVEWVVPKTAHPGDEAAIFLPGSGFVAMGRLATEPALGAGFGRNEKSWRADVRGVRILEEPVPIESVEEAIPEWKWPRYPKSLTTVPTTYAAALRAELTRSRPAADDAIPEQAGADEVFTEGATTSVRVNAFETSAVAKRRCVEHYGCRCAICGLKFDEAYGPAGEGLIHVHHLVPLASIRREYEINPVKDLRPVCPNCHALIHRRSPPYSPEEVKSMLKEAKGAR